MDYLENTKKEIQFGDIFMIPLFLPYENMEIFINYKKYLFRKDDIYAYGRLIDIDMGNCELIEVFAYVGKIPDTSEIIINSGRMFAPVFAAAPFESSRWRFLFATPDYDKRTDSDYENITVLYPLAPPLPPRIWKGGRTVSITQQQYDELEKAGAEHNAIYVSINIENRIRTLLAEQGVELNYEKIVEERQNEYPKPRDMDKKLKQTIAPFRWFSESGRYSFLLDAGMINQECFEKYHLLGNGYDWEKVALAFMEKNMPDSKRTFQFDCEADTFFMQSAKKKPLKEFALAFHAFSTDTEAFDTLLGEIQIEN